MNEQTYSLIAVLDLPCVFDHNAQRYYHGCLTVLVCLVVDKKAEWKLTLGRPVDQISERARHVGARHARSNSWLLSSPQQPLETEDPPTVSLAPQYTLQRLCHASTSISRLESAHFY